MFKPLLRLRISASAVVPLTAVLFTLSALGNAFAQTPDAPTPKKTYTPVTDASVGVYGQLTGTRTPIDTQVASFGTITTQTTQGASPSAGVFGTFHQSFRPWLGYNVNFGYTRLTENYSVGQAFVPGTTSTASPSSSLVQGSIPSSMYDLTIAYVFEGPKTTRFSTFGQFGGGGLFFVPDSIDGARNQTRPAMVFGVGANYKLSSHLALRAEYRGFFYKSPDFTIPPFDGRSFPMSRLFTVTSAPAVSLVYRFGGTKSQGTAKPSR